MVDLPEGIQSFNKHIKLATSVDQIQQKKDIFTITISFTLERDLQK